jgi:hypothetical protein
MDPPSSVDVGKMALPVVLAPVEIKQHRLTGPGWMNTGALNS